MREIKFRFWYASIEDINKGFMKENVEYNIEDPEFFETKEGFKSPIPMQYIGFTDKNNKQIYEGDILKYKWVNDICVFEISNKLKDSCGCEGIIYGWEAAYPIEESEVIGNIYQNPELLEKKE